MKYSLEVFNTAALCRNFEDLTAYYIKKKRIYTPTYLSTGQEFIASSLSTICKRKKIKPYLFGQHRCHSIYLAFGGKVEPLIDELLGYKTGVNKGFAGSTLLGEKKINMYGHDSCMGTNGPIGVGACFVTQKPTIIFLGDAAVEEDYVLGAMGWAAKKNLPIIFVVEDNNFSILTEKSVRRDWKIKDVAKSFKFNAFDIKDDPKEILKKSKLFFKKPLLLNISTNRIYDHRGGDKKDKKELDRYIIEMKKIGHKAKNLDKKCKNYLEKKWHRRLEKQ